MARDRLDHSRVYDIYREVVGKDRGVCLGLHPVLHNSPHLSTSGSLWEAMGLGPGKKVVSVCFWLANKDLWAKGEEEGLGQAYPTCAIYHPRVFLQFHHRSDDT